MELLDRDKFILARWTYSLGEPIYSDAEYTRMLQAMLVSNPDDEYVKRSWSSDPCPVELLKRIGREDLIAQVVLGDRTESIPSLNTAIDVQRKLQFFNGVGTLSMKHDGWHMQANYFNGSLVSVQTRGRYKDAINADVLRNMIPDKIPALGTIRVSMEATVGRTNYLFCASHFQSKSPRSAVSTLLANPEYIHLLSVHAFDIFGYDLKERCKFEVLQEWGFPVPKYFKVYNYSDILSCLNELSTFNTSYEYPTDGAVFDGDKRRAIRLLAWEEPIYYSFVTGYLEQYSMYRLNPSVLIYPVMRGGSTQRRVNITNWQRILDKDLCPDSPIAFRIASSSIADYDDEATRLLRIEYKGKWDEYKNKIKTDEEVKRHQWLMLSNNVGSCSSYL